jgi:hypothetical protein
VIGPKYLNEGQVATVSGVIKDSGYDQQKIQIDWTGNGELETSVPLPLASTVPCPPPEMGYCTPFSQDYVYADGGTYERTIKVIDDDGDSMWFHDTIYVQNVPPKVTSFIAADNAGIGVIGENDQIESGTLVEIYVEFSAPGDDLYSAGVLWGDTSTPTVLPAQSEHEFYASHTYVSAGERSIAIQITDDDGRSVWARSVPFRVGDPPPPPIQMPTAQLTGPYSAAEGEAIVANASGSTVDPSKTAAYRWDFDGDGSWDTGRSADPVSPPWHGPDPLQPDDYSGTLRVEVWDGTNAAVAETAVEFTNVSPAVVGNAMNIGLTEGETQLFEVLISDPGHDGFTLVVDWNNYSDDDESSYYYLNPGETEIYISHVYRDNPPGQPFGSYQVRFEVIDDDGGSSFKYESAEVVNQLPAITIGGVFNSELQSLGPVPPEDSETIVAGRPARLFVTWSDPGLDDTHEVLIEWGDGSSTPLSDPDPIFEVSHTYEILGTYQVKVTITDNDGGDEFRFSQPFTVTDVIMQDGFEYPQ